MKRFISCLFAVFVTTGSIAQVNPIIPNTPPKKQELPVPKPVTLKPDLTIAIEKVLEAVYNPVDKITTVKVDVAVRNNSDAATTTAHTISAAIFRHAETNADHMFWHIGDFQTGTLVPAEATVKRRLVFKIKSMMPPLSTPYRFMVEADKKYVIDESDETNNQSNEVEVMVTTKASS
jgi:hypothetical protein